MARDSDLKELWRERDNGAVLRTPAIGLDGILHLSLTNQRVMLRKPTGEILHTTPAYHDPRWTPCIAEDGTLILANSNRFLVRYDDVGSARAIPGATNSVFLIPKVSVTDEGGYNVLLSNPSGAGLVGRFSLQTLDPLPKLITDLHHQSVPLGANLRWEIAAEGLGPLSYRWMFESKPLTTTPSNSITLTNADLRFEGNYQVIVENAYGAVTSSIARVTLGLPINVLVWGSNTVAKAVPPDITNAVSIAAAGHILALREDGTVAAWGLNTEGQATVPKGLSNVVAVSAGSAHSLALRADGTVAAWGRNVEGQTNIPPQLTNVIAIAAGSNVNLAIRADRTVTAWGDTRYGQTPVPPALTNVIAITANGSASFALTEDGTIVGWGTNSLVPAGLGRVPWFGGRAKIVSPGPAQRIVTWTGDTNTFTSEASNRGTMADSYEEPIPWIAGVTRYQTHEILLTEAGGIETWGGDPFGKYTPPPNISNAVWVAAGVDFDAAVVAGPVILLQPEDQTVSAGEGVEFSVTASSLHPILYQWQLFGTNLVGETQPTLRIANAGAEHYGPYTVIVTDKRSKQRSRAALLQVRTGPPYVTQHPANLTKAVGSGAEFVGAVEGVSPITYQWYQNGTPLPGATQPRLRIPSVTLADSGRYSFQAVNPLGKTESLGANLIVFSPEVSIGASRATVIGIWQTGSLISAQQPRVLYTRESTGTNRIIFDTDLPRRGFYRVSTWIDAEINRVSGSGTPLFHIVHHSEGTFAALPIPLSLSRFSSHWSSLGVFPFTTHAQIELIDLFPSRTLYGFGEAVLFTYIATPPSIMTQPSNVEVEEGDPFDLRVSAISEALSFYGLTVSPSQVAPLEFFWQKDGQYLLGETNATLQVTRAAMSDQGGYATQVTNPDGTIFTRTATVTVQPAPLQLRITAGSFELFWKGSATLQTSTNVSGPYESLPSATSPTPITAEEYQRYYRLTR